MIHLKSVLCGFAAVIVAVFAAGVVIATSVAIQSRNLPPAESYGWDPVSLFRQSVLIWMLLAAAFVIGYVWQYRREVARAGTGRV